MAFRGSTTINDALPDPGTFTGDKGFPNDPKKGAQLTNGANLCNLVQYLNYMAKNPDKIADLDARRNKGLNSGQFEGSASLVYAGGLRWTGQDWDFNSLGALD